MASNAELQLTTGIDRIKDALELDSDSTVYEWIQHRKFPRPIKLTDKCARWLVSEVNDWISTHIQERDRRPLETRPKHDRRTLKKREQEKAAA